MDYARAGIAADDGNSIIQCCPEELSDEGSQTPPARGDGADLFGAMKHEILHVVSLLRMTRCVIFEQISQIN